MVSDDTRAILGSDLAKVFTAAIAFVAVYILMPIIYSALVRVLGALDIGAINDMSFGTFFGLFMTVLLLLFWTIFLFFGIFKLVSSLRKKYGTQILRSKSQEGVRVVMIIIGFFLAGILVFNYYLSPLLSSFEIFPVFDLFALLYWGFSFLSVMIAATLATLLIIIFGLVFISDIIFHFIRKGRNQPLQYEGRSRERRRYNYLKVTTLILIVFVLITAGLIYFVRPTTFRLEGGEVDIQYNGSLVEHTVAIQFLDIYTSTVSAESWESLDALNPSADNYFMKNPLDTIVFRLYVMDEVANFASKHYQNTISQGRSIDGFFLLLEIDGTSLEAIYYPSSDGQNTRCNYLSKVIQLESITIEFSGDTPVSFTFTMSIIEEFVVEDLI